MDRCLRRKLEHGKVDIGASAAASRLGSKDHGGRTSPNRSTLKRRRSKLSLESLSEDLLQSVVSRLTLKEAGRTSILSSRWKDRWACHPNLCFHSSKLPVHDVDRFINHVNTVVKRHSSLVVDKFKVTVALGKQHADHVDRWVGFVTASKAKHVVLDLNPAVSTHRQCEAPDKYEFCPAVNSGHHCKAADRYGFCPALHAHYQTKADKYEFPVNLLSGRNGSCIVSLRLGLMCLKLSSDLFGFENLKKLELHFVSDLENLCLFLANCPGLEWLSITHSSLPDLNIPHQLHHLHYLLVSDCCVQSIELHAMGLTAFEYVGLPVPIKIDDCFKLSKANITLRRSFGNVHYIVNELASSLAHVDNLFIKFSGLDTKRTELTDNLGKFIHLTHLILDFTIRRDPSSPFDVLQLTYILEASPQLEHFVLHMHARYSRPKVMRTTNDVCPHLHHHLKTVHMTGVFGFAGQLELAKYILLSADSLKHMTIDIAKERYPHVPWVSYPDQVLAVEELAKCYLDPRGVHGDVLTVLGIVPSYKER